MVEVSGEQLECSLAIGGTFSRRETAHVVGGFGDVAEGNRDTGGHCEGSDG